ncbi:hypothetical protein CBS101457_005131 [Exobasidium rhododendri]|nr:hypothetical protein CBS101457_005131 [Exobasidium rhododendri]
MAGYPPPGGDPYYRQNTTCENYSGQARYPPPPPPPPQQQQQQRQSMGVPNADAYARIYSGPAAPPMTAFPPSQMALSGLANYSTYPRQNIVPPPPPPSIPMQQQYYLPQQQQMSAQMYQQPSSMAVYPAAQINPYTCQPMYGYGQAVSASSLPPPQQQQMSYSNPYDPYGNAMAAALARSYQEGYEGRGRTRHRDDEEDEDFVSERAGAKESRSRRNSRSEEGGGGKKWHDELSEVAVSLVSMLPPNTGSVWTDAVSTDDT